MHWTINGRSYQADPDIRTTVLDLLREHLGLTGSKKGCDHGQCGACTVLIDGRRVNSCLTLAVMHQGEAEAGVDPLPVDQHRAGPALAVVAALLGPGKLQPLTQQVQQGRPRIDVERLFTAVDAQSQVHAALRRGHAAL